MAKIVQAVQPMPVFAPSPQDDSKAELNDDVMIKVFSVDQAVEPTDSYIHLTMNTSICKKTPQDPVSPRGLLLSPVPMNV